MEIILVRHAQNVLPSSRKSIDKHFIEETPLTSLGQEQAKQLAIKLKTLRSVQSTILVSSPAKRCVATAEEVGRALGLEFLLENRVADRSPGNQRFESLTHYREWQLDAWQNPDKSHHNAESLISMRRRVRSWLLSIQGADADRMIVVTHGSVIEKVTGILLGIPTKRMAASFLQCDHAHFHIWELRGSGEAILTQTNTSPFEASGPNPQDAHAAISNRLSTGGSASAFVVDKYYVR
ncbi:hypothetical protein GTP91_14045 [Rugamonas sp. FT82W]|uniref:Histidine phosphatase family protein n=1 Tax=Duganella vulcania TaxID=2692166 RepID=A0A845G5D7_9BURK|nr:histidine phosphatase family protein [Duganella vulcania]MYM88296.1 hypothetical protein [Duganella vulcania]